MPRARPAATLRTLLALALATCTPAPRAAAPAPVPHPGVEARAAPAPSASVVTAAPARPEAAALDAESRRKFDELVEALAVANANGDPKAPALFEEAHRLADSGELWFEGGLLAQKQGHPAEAERRFETAATLLERQYHTRFERVAFDGRVIPLVFASPSRLWLGQEWLYDVGRRRVIARAPPGTTLKPGRVSNAFAAAGDWVFGGKELWSVRTNRRVAAIGADAAVPSASGADLYVLRGEELFKYAADTGEQAGRLGTVPRDPKEPSYPRFMSVAPAEHLVTINAYSVGVYDLRQPKPEAVKLPEAFDAVALANDWVASVDAKGITLRQYPAGKRLFRAWSAAPYSGGRFAVSRDGTRFSISDPVAEEAPVFEVPPEGTRTLKPLVRFEHILELLPVALSADGALVTALCPNGRKLCLVETETRKVETSFDTPPASREGLCAIGVRVYPLELCRSRTAPLPTAPKNGSAPR